MPRMTGQLTVQLTLGQAEGGVSDQTIGCSRIALYN